MTTWAHGMLPNGMRVTAVRIPGARALGVTVVIGGGFSSEGEGEAGRAHLVEHLLHHDARDAAGDSIDRRVRAAGGLSNAQTYPFHTEYSVLVPASTDDERAAWIRAALGRLGALHVSAGAIEREREVMRREIAERTARSPLAGFPWSMALATLSAAPIRDGLTDLSGLCDVTPRDIRGFHDDRREAANCALGIAADIEPAALLDLAGAVPCADHALRLALTDTTPRDVRVVRPGLTMPVHAETRRADLGPDASIARGLLMIAAGIASATTGGTWRTGLFGPLLGPDPHIVLSTHTGAVAAAAMRMPTAVPRAQERRDAMNAARAGARRTVDEYLNGTATASALAARDAFAGLDMARTRAAITDARSADVLALLDDVERSPAGRLTWEGGFVPERQEEAA